MNTLLIVAGIAALVYWWLSRKPAAPDEPVKPAPVSPGKRFDAIRETWVLVDSLKDDDCFKGNDEAQTHLASLKSIAAEALEK